MSFPCSDDLIGTADTEDIVQNRRGNDPSEIFDIREYAPGDDIRSISLEAVLQNRFPHSPSGKRAVSL